MPTVEFKRENGKLYFRSRKLLHDSIFLYNNSDGEGVYEDVLKEDGWSEWQEVP